MSRPATMLGWLEDKSDWLSPLVVKEVRQVVRGREFYFSFAGGLVAGLAVAFFGAADALTGSGTSGGWTFIALITCLAFIGLAVVPLGAFSALRHERTEQTLDLITLTALSPRRVIVGKLLAQSVKLGTLFAAMAPFIAMSFLLGGVDFITISVSLAVLFLWSVWTSALCLFLSTLFKSRTMSGLIFAAVGVGVLLILALARTVMFVAGRGAPLSAFGFTAGSPLWWALAIVTTFCLASMVNIVLLAENRLSLPTEDRVTPVRAGLFVQFLLIVGWTLTFANATPRAQTEALEVLIVTSAIQLAIVALFTVTEDLVVSRRVLLRMRSPSSWRWLLTMFRPGGGRGALYVLVQMVVLVLATWFFEPDWIEVRWLLAICGYICFFTGVPVFVFRFLRPASAATLRLRVVLLILLAVVMVLPDVIHYVVWQPAILDLNFSARHLVNPIATLGNWHIVESNEWFAIPLVLGLMGVIAYAGLIYLGSRMTAHMVPADTRDSAAAAGEPGSASLY